MGQYFENEKLEDKFTFLLFKPNRLFMKLKLALYSAVFLLCSMINFTYAQNLTVTGTVKNKSTGESLIGATIILKGATTAVRSNAAGEFSISVPGKGSVLIISYSGMITTDYTIGNVTSGIIIMMEESASTTLTDVVVIGYGTQKVTKVSGAISSVKSGDIEKLKPVRAEEALQGRASGVTVIQGGTPARTVPMRNSRSSAFPSAS